MLTVNKRPILPPIYFEDPNHPSLWNLHENSFLVYLYNKYKNGTAVGDMEYVLPQVIKDWDEVDPRYVWGLTGLLDNLSFWTRQEEKVMNFAIKHFQPHMLLPHVEEVTRETGNSSTLLIDRFCENNKLVVWSEAILEAQNGGNPLYAELLVSGEEFIERFSDFYANILSLATVSSINDLKADIKELFVG